MNQWAFISFSDEQLVTKYKIQWPFIYLTSCLDSGRLLITGEGKEVKITIGINKEQEKGFNHMR